MVSSISARDAAGSCGPVSISVLAAPVIQISQGPYIKGPYIKGPYIKGPSLVIPREDGTETHLDIAALEAAAPKREEG